MSTLARDQILLERVLMHAEASVPESDRGRLVELVCHGTPSELFFFLRQRLSTEQLLSCIPGNEMA